MTLTKLKVAAATLAVAAGVAVTAAPPASAATKYLGTMSCKLAAGWVDLQFTYIASASSTIATYDSVYMSTTGFDGRPFDVNLAEIYWLYRHTDGSDTWTKLWGKGAASSANYVKHDTAFYPVGSINTAGDGAFGGPSIMRLKSYIVDGVGVSSGTNTCSGQVDIITKRG